MERCLCTYIIFVGVLFIGFNFESKCDEKFYIYQEEYGNCTNCKTFCKNGTQLSHSCNEENPVVPKNQTLRCIPCQAGTYSSGGLSSCKNCSKQCAKEKHEVEGQTCNSSHDRTCVCQTGYYKSSLADVCLPCCECGSGGTVKPECKASHHSKHCSCTTNTTVITTTPSSTASTTTEATHNTEMDRSLVIAVWTLGVLLFITLVVLIVLIVLLSKQCQNCQNPSKQANNGESVDYGSFSTQNLQFDEVSI